MSEEKVDAKLRQESGKVKETFGKASNNKSLEAEGKVENTSGKVDEFTTDVKDSIKGLSKGLKDIK